MGARILRNLSSSAIHPHSAHVATKHCSLPSLSSLTAFEWVSSHFNLFRAAEELNVTQGAVSRQVRALKADLDVPLIVRLAAMLYIRFPLSLRNVEDLWHERCISLGLGTDPPNSRIRTSASSVARFSPPFFFRTISPRFDVPYQRRAEGMFSLHRIDQRDGSAEDVKRPDAAALFLEGRADWPGSAAVAVRQDAERTLKRC